MRLPKKLRVTFPSFGLLLLVNLSQVLALDSSDSHSHPPGVIHLENVDVNSTNSHSLPQPAATEVHFEQTPTRYTKAVSTSGHILDHVPYLKDQHYQNDESHFSSASASSLTSRDNCKLPESWKGKWFQSGVMQPILIDGKSMGDKGVCIERSHDKFLFVEVDKNNGCYRCLVINERHRNVLQYKETVFCHEKDNLENLCSEITGDAVLFSLFRVAGDGGSPILPIPCPFQGSFTFTYDRGYGECRYPLSNMLPCHTPETEQNSRLLISYESCPNVAKSESVAETLECLAEWKEGSHNYLLGKLKRDRAIVSNEDSYRCFIYERTKNHMGYNVAISGDASCSALTSPTEGARTLTFTKVVDNGEVNCRFPSWLSSYHWHSLDGKMSAKMHHKNSTMHITGNSSGHYSGLSSSSSTNTGTFTGTGSTGNYIGGGGVGASSSLFTGGTRISCQNRKDISDRHVAIVAHHTEGCKSEKICMHIYKRGSHVTEIQMRRSSDHGGEDFDCLKSDALGPTLPYVTLVNPDAKSFRCPNLGRYMASGVTQDGRVVRDACGPSGGQGAFHSVVVGCGNRATMEFHSKCDRQEPITAYECHGAFEENGTGFLIASPLSRSSTSARRFCFTYLETDEGLRVSSSSESCRRNFSPGVSPEGIWAFNLTIDGQCAEAVTGASASSFKSCDLLVSVTLLSSVIFMTFSNFLLVSYPSIFTSSSSSLLLSSTEKLRPGGGLRGIFR